MYAHELIGRKALRSAPCLVDGDWSRSYMVSPVVIRNVTATHIYFSHVGRPSTDRDMESDNVYIPLLLRPLGAVSSKPKFKEPSPSNPEQEPSPEVHVLTAEWLDNAWVPYLPEPVCEFVVERAQA